MSVALRYSVNIDQPQRHLAAITFEIDGVAADTLRVQMPAWTPGSYLMREYARHVRNVQAFSGSQALTCRKLDKLSWEIDTRGVQSVQVRYLVYGHDLTVRTNHIDATHAHLTPAATFMFVPERSSEPLEVSISAPDGWQITTGLDPLTPGATTFRADDFDHLVDAPFEIGVQRRLEWDVDGKRHALVIWGQGNEDDEQLVSDAKTIVETERDFWGSLPYAHYTFILLLGGPNAGGGLEHRNSTVLLLPRHIFRPSSNYERYLSLVSHEFFHTWNVKRLRAAPLGPFDYTNENYTRLLWVMEGFTEYYTDLLLVRGGLITPERYLARLAKDIVTLQTTPGRLVQSVSEASLDAWVKLYRPDETTPNTTISYYLKGALVALILDMEIRQRTQGQRSLDDLIRLLYATYPSSGPGIPEDNGMLQALEQIAPGDWSALLAQYVDGVAELPFAAALETVGLTLNWSYKHSVEGGDAPQPSLGVRTKAVDGRIKLTHVLDGGAADQAGLAPNDELIAIDGWRVDHDTLQNRLADYSVGATVEVSFFRNDVLHTLPLTFTKPEYDQLTLERSAEPSAEQEANYRSWLNQAPANSTQPAAAATTPVGTEEISRAPQKRRS